MIKKRNNINNNDNSEKKSKTFSLLSEDITTYREEAILIINDLKANGINIYDENRKGGMYLRKNNDEKNIFEGNLRDNFISKKSETENNEKLHNVFKHLIKK